MGFMSSLLFWRKDPKEAEVKRVWDEFVDTFIDTMAAKGPVAAPPPAVPEQIETVVPASERVVSIGDIHGDLGKAKEAFQVAGLTDLSDRWIGKDAVCVQVGDQVDRGDNELEVLYFLESVQAQARAAGGNVYMLIGNHEVMNCYGDFRYGTKRASAGFLRYYYLKALGHNLKRSCGYKRKIKISDKDRLPLPFAYAGTIEQQMRQARLAAFSPGGPLCQRFFARNQVVLQVGSSIYVHAGLEKQHVEHTLEALNQDSRQWLMGTESTIPDFLAGRDAVVWTRSYSHVDEAKCLCGQLQEVLGMIPSATRMVVGHTIQPGGISTACGEQVVRVDVGMSRGCINGLPEAFEVENDRVLKSHKAEVEEQENGVSQLVSWFKRVVSSVNFLGR